MSERIYNAIILNEPYAGWVKDGKKKIETRMRWLKQLEGEIIICCDKGKSVGSPNFGKAICLVTSAGPRSMSDDDTKDACIENVPGRIAYPLSNRRLFSYNFNFSEYAVVEAGKRNANWQGIFKIKIPDFVQLLPNEQEDQRSVARNDATLTDDGKQKNNIK